MFVAPELVRSNPRVFIYLRVFVRKDELAKWSFFAANIPHET
jgi:hypothetical protein